MKKKKVLIVIICLLAVLTAVLGIIFSKKGPISRRNQANLGTLLADLVKASEEGPGAGLDQIDRDLADIQKTAKKDYALAETIALYWEKVYLDENYVLNMYKGERAAEGLENSGIPEGKSHAIVVLGYELADGMMQDELKGRCEAAAALARSYPEAILVCSGGATGENNPDKNTEAGLMKKYLSENCGIEGDRIFIDEDAMTTQENAINTFKILQTQKISTMTIVTSSYHQKWGQVVYNAVAELYKQQHDYSVEIISNYCYETEPSVELYEKDARIAAMQIARILELSKEARDLLPNPFGK